MIHWVTRALIESTDMVQLSAFSLKEVNTQINRIVCRPENFNPDSLIIDFDGHFGKVSTEKMEVVDIDEKATRRLKEDAVTIDECLAELLYMKCLIDQAM